MFRNNLKVNTFLLFLILGLGFFTGFNNILEKKLSKQEANLNFLAATTQGDKWLDSLSSDFIGTKSNVAVSSTGFVLLLKPEGARCGHDIECKTGICDLSLCQPPACGTDTTKLYSGQTYNLVSLGRNCWFKDNLNIGNQINNTVLPAQNNSIEKWCYNNDSNICGTTSPNEGGLYAWAEAMQFDPACNSTACSYNGNRQGVCPPGWHIPSDSEWTTTAPQINYTFGLKLAGFRNVGTSASFFDRGSRGYFWATSASDSSNVWYRYLLSESSINRTTSGKTAGMSVRCIKDRGLSTGSSCTSDSQCSSGYCPSAAPRVCKVPTGNSCIGSSETEKNTNCAIGNCDFDGYCRGKAGATCSQNTDCSTGTSCVSGYCMVSYTLIQTNNSAVTPQPPNALTGGFNNVAVADPVEVNPAGAGGQDGDARLYFVPPVMCPGDYLHGDCSGGMWYCDVYTNALPCNSMSACTWTNIPYVCGGNQYRTSGSYNSFLDAGASTASWRTVQVTKGNSASTDGSVRVQVKVSNSGTTAPTFDATGVNCDFTVSSNGSSGNKDLTTCSNLGTGRYLWYKATFSSPANTRTPTLMDFSATLFSTAAPIPQAKISLSTSTLNFASMINSEPAPQTAVVQNSGTATLNWTASSTQSWCRITSATSGQLIPGATTTLTVSPTALSSTNSYICDVSVTDSSASNSPQKIRVNYTVQSPLAVINLSTSNLYFYSVVNSIPSSQGVTIKNNGIQNQLVWSANPNQSWCAASPSSGTLSPGASSLVSISVGSFSTGGTRSCQISFSDNNASNSPQPLSVSYSVSTCGNGSVEPGEDCEPGQTSDCCSGFQTCSSSCTWQTNTCNNSCTACNSCDANSCPFLYAYNGSEYKFQTDIVSAGKLGYRGNPKPVSDDYFLFPASEMKSVNGNYSIIIKEERNEVDYLDMVKFYYIDHDPVISVYADNIRENQARMSTDMPLFTVNTNTVRLPISCTYNDYNCLEDIKKIDGIYTVPQKYWTWNKMTLDFGDLSGENTIKLVLRGFQIPPSSPGTPVFDEKIHGPRPKNHYKLEIIDKNGSWKEVDTKYITINPAEAVRTYVADLSGIFESDDYRIRISYIFDDRFDYVALDTSANTPIEVKELKLAKAELSATKTISYLDFSKFPIDYQYNDPFIKPIYKYYYSGYFTKLGDITPLLEKTDDKFAILNVADEIKLEIQEPPKLEEGKVRTILIHSNGFYKTSMYGIVDSTVDPLPFQKMTKYPYSTSTENYPYGSEHIEYLKEWNTRYCESGKDKCYAKERADL